MKLNTVNAELKVMLLINIQKYQKKIGNKKKKNSKIKFIFFLLHLVS